MKETQPDREEEMSSTEFDEGEGGDSATGTNKRAIVASIFSLKNGVILVMGIVILGLSLSISSKNERYETMVDSRLGYMQSNQLGFPNERPCPLVFRTISSSNDQQEGPITEMEGCSSNKIVSILRQGFNETQCPWDFTYDMQLRTRTFSRQKMMEYLDRLCDEAQQAMWDQTPRKEWVDHVDSRLSPDYLTELLVHGETVLNLNTGNIQNADGTDPRANDYYPTDEESFQVGRSVRSYYEQYGTSTILVQEPSFDSYDNCQLQTITCCYGRDRQSGDNNGNCQTRDCDDARPGDNTNLCYYKDRVFPGDETIHCHGFAWSNNETDASYRLRFNSMFYSFFYDHWYTRGYVESILPGDAPMCGCIEDMPTVVRADCTEAYLKNKYYVEISSDGNNNLVIVPGPLKVDFRSCRGPRSNNDLASKIDQLNLDGQLDNEKRDILFQHYLVGHDDPNNNVNEEACEAAWDQEQESPRLEWNLDSSSANTTFLLPCFLLTTALFSNFLSY